MCFLYMTTYKLIAAMDRNNAIGFNNSMPWHLPADFKHFKQTTLNSVVLMGRKTAESLPGLLPNRLNLILTRGTDVSQNVQKMLDQGAQLVHSNTDIDKYVDVFYHQHPESSGAHDKTVWVIGGGDVYKQYISQAFELVVSHVNTHLAEADAHFPRISDEWVTVSETMHRADGNNPYAFEIVVYQKRQKD